MMISTESPEAQESEISGGQPQEKGDAGNAPKQEILSVAVNSLPNVLVAAKDAESDSPVVEKACYLCNQMISDLKGPLKRLYAEDPEFLNFKEGVREVKAALSNKKSKKARDLNEYFSANGVDEDEMAMIRDFGTALVSTIEYLSAVDPMKQRDNEADSRYKEVCAGLGACANNAYGKFFMNMQQRHNLKEGDMYKLVNSVFTNPELYDAFRGRDTGEFHVGVFTFVKAYSLLDETAESEGRWQLPTPEEDTREAVDLIRMPEDSKEAAKLFTIKTGNPDTRINIYDLDTYWKEGHADYVRNAFSPLKRGSIEEAATTLRDAARKRRAAGENVKAYLVLA